VPYEKAIKLYTDKVILVEIPGATQDSSESPGFGANQRIFLRFIESSYVTLDPERGTKD